MAQGTTTVPGSTTESVETITVTEGTTSTQGTTKVPGSTTSPVETTTVTEGTTYA